MLDFWNIKRRNVKTIEAKVKSGKHLFAAGGGITRAMTLPIDNDTSRKRGKMKSCRCDADVGCFPIASCRFLLNEDMDKASDWKFEA